LALLIWYLIVCPSSHSVRQRTASFSDQRLIVKGDRVLSIVRRVLPFISMNVFEIKGHYMIGLISKSREARGSKSCGEFAHVLYFKEVKFDAFEKMRSPCYGRALTIHVTE